MDKLLRFTIKDTAPVEPIPADLYKAMLEFTRRRQKAWTPNLITATQPDTEDSDASHDNR